MSGSRKKPPPDKPKSEPQWSVIQHEEGVSYRSAITGRYVSKSAASKHPKTTVVEKRSKVETFNVKPGAKSRKAKKQ